MENLKENQIVWAQFEGYPWWPSVIKKIENGAKICVLFLGTDEKGIVPINKIREWSDENFPEYVKNIKINKIKEMSAEERKETFQLLLGIAMTLQIQEGNFEYKTFEEFKKSHQEKEYIQIAIKFVNFVQSQGKKDGHNEEFDICLLDEYFPEDENEQSLINHHQNKCRKFKGEIDVFHKFIEEHPLSKNNKNAMIKNKKELKEFSEEISTYIQNGFENRLINLLRSLGLDLPSYDVNTIREQITQIKNILNKEDITKYRKTTYEELHWFFRKICNELFNKIEIETKENEKLISYCTIDFD
ncbi:MAG: PWWP domain-containing protein, partial [archaeon]|nr:PWWP domain-containing protein [archaeon]